MVRLDKKDELRGLLTDTAPADVPIIFSNDGFYINAKFSQERDGAAPFNIFCSMYENITNPKGSTKRALPFRYRVYKNEISDRVLSLVHPRFQELYCNFYREYASAIAYLCNKSNFSIRAPIKVASSFYSHQGSGEVKYKGFEGEQEYNELMRRHVTSFFAYSGFNRVHKFFSSDIYHECEKKFRVLKILDVANCFDSIYTHSISWAIKGKESIKSSISSGTAPYSFYDYLDVVMRSSNDQETNGIPVGSEFSRIFAEIIFQEIDRKTEAEIYERCGLEQGRDYSIFRYVDDFFVFGKSNSVIDKVVSCLSERLSRYNFYLNEGKVEQYNRPFLTSKSESIKKANGCIEQFLNKLAEEVYQDGSKKYIPKKIYNRSGFVKNFFDELKLACGLPNSSYSEISGFVVSVLAKRLKSFSRNMVFGGFDQNGEVKLYFNEARDCICILIEVMFFLFTVDPTSGSSNRLAKAIKEADEFFENKNNAFLNQFRTEVAGYISSLEFFDSVHFGRDHVSLERLNIYVVVSDFGRNFIEPIDDLCDLDFRSLNYFEIISLLYCFKDYSRYSESITRIEDVVLERLEDLERLHHCSESAHLFLDIVCCPYFNRFKREELVRRYLDHFCAANVGLGLDVSNLASDLEAGYWFVNWTGLDLINLLERKELRETY